MEYKKMLKSIDVSMFDENEVISLLLKVIELLNGNASRLNTDLEQATAKIAEQEATIKKLSEEKNKANDLVQEKTKEISNLSKENKQLQSELSTKTQELEDCKNKLNNIIAENKIGVVKIYANMISDLLVLCKCENSYWNKYLADICHKIGKFVEEATNIEILSFSLKSSNSWLTKIASIIWWSKLPTISNVVNKNVPNINALNKVFDNLVQFLININITIQLPNCELCVVMDKYEANFKEKTNFNNLFENSEIPEGTLCEIYKLAINDSNGLCLTFNS